MVNMFEPAACIAFQRSRGYLKRYLIVDRTFWTVISMLSLAMVAGA